MPTANSATALEPAKPQKTKAERAAERLARLTPWKPGQSGNPLGGALPKRKIWDQFRQFMASPSDFSEHGESNRVLLWKATMQSAVMGEPASQSALIDHDLGTEDGLLSLAEHFRRVETSRFEFCRDLLGDKVKGMTPPQLADYFARMAPDVLGFIRMAMIILGGDTTPQLEASPPEHAGSGDPVSAGQTESPEPGPARSGDDDGGVGE